MALNPWMQHVQKVRKANPNMAYKDVLVKAKASYKKKAPAGATKKPIKPSPARKTKKAEKPTEE